MSQQVIRNSEVKPNDVLCGRGGATNNHEGNIQYRRIVASHQDEYLHAKKRDKRAIARKIVDVIRQNGGRFLKRVECLGGAWTDVGDQKAVEKTSQALREGLDVRRGEVEGSDEQGSVKRKNSNDSADAKRKKKVKFSSDRGTGNAAATDEPNQEAEQWEAQLRNMVSSSLSPMVSETDGTSGIVQPAVSEDSKAPSSASRPNMSTLTRKISAEMVVPV